VTTLKLRLSAAWCNKCGRITGRDDKGNCLVCTQIMAKEWEARNADSK